MKLKNPLQDLYDVRHLAAVAQLVTGQNIVSSTITLYDFDFLGHGKKVKV